MNYRKQIDKYLSYIDSVRRMRGKDYQQSGRVQITNIDTYKNMILNVEARVKGSHSTYYSLQINMRDDNTRTKVLGSLLLP